MHFWKSSTSKSASSSPSSPQRTITSRNPFARREIAPSTTQPRLTRQHNLKYVDNLDERRYSDDSAASTPGAITRSPSNLEPAETPARPSSSFFPQPLPLPDEAGSRANPTFLASPQSELGLCNGGCRLPSPAANFCKEDREKETGAATAVQEASSPVHSKSFRIGNPSRSPESVDLFSTIPSSQIFKNPSHHHNSSEPSDFRMTMPIKSAPGSGFTSPVRSPRRFSNADFTQGLNIPAAEFLTSGENYLNSPDRSPRSSPLRSPGLRPRNLSGPPSPLHSNGNGGLNNVHRLPLPPGVVGSSASSSTTSNTYSLAGQWQKGRLIGSGTFGNVFEATNRHTGALCAMKEVNIIPEDAKSIESLKQLQQEILLLSEFRHPNIVQYYGSEITEDRFYIYLEYVHPGSINKYVSQRYGSGAMTESVVRNFTRHILTGLAYLHSKKIMHRDIKGANLLVDAKGIVKLADFGMAKRLSEAAPNLSLKGTSYWMAPEVLQATIVKENGGYNLAVDIWSLGCTLIEMFTGKPPWSGLEGPAAMFKVLHKTPPIPESLSSEGKDFLQKCFRRNPAERPTASLLLEHPFIRNASYYNAHGAVSPAISTMKISDTTYNAKERRPSKSDPCLKGPLTHSYPKSPEPLASHTRPHSNPDIPYNLSPQHPSYAPSTHTNSNSCPVNRNSYNLSSQHPASVSYTNTNTNTNTNTSTISINGGLQHVQSSANTTFMNGSNYLTSNANASIFTSSIAGNFHPTVLPRPKELHNP